MLIGTMATLAMTSLTMAAATPAPENPNIATIGLATSALLEATPNLATAEFRDVRVVALPGRHQAVCGEVNGGTGSYRRFAYDTVTREAQAEGGGAFATLWANCGG